MTATVTNERTFLCRYTEQELREIVKILKKETDSDPGYFVGTSFFQDLITDKEAALEGKQEKESLPF